MGEKLKKIFGCGKNKHPQNKITILNEKYAKCLLCGDVWTIDRKSK